MRNSTFLAISEMIDWVTPWHGIWTIYSAYGIHVKAIYYGIMGIEPVNCSEGLK